MKATPRHSEYADAAQEKAGQPLRRSRVPKQSFVTQTNSAKAMFCLGGDAERSLQFGPVSVCTSGLLVDGPVDVLAMLRDMDDTPAIPMTD